MIIAGILALIIAVLWLVTNVNWIYRLIELVFGAAITYLFFGMIYVSYFT